MVARIRTVSTFYLAGRSATLHGMLTGALRNRVDRLWDAFWSGGISNPLEVVEQLTYLLFLRRWDELLTLQENRVSRPIQPGVRLLFPEGIDPQGRRYSDLRWSCFKTFEPRELFLVMAEHVFPYLRRLGGDGSPSAHSMKDARFTIPTPVLLAKAVALVDQVPMEERDTLGDLYEYMLSKIASAGQNGQFRTPRHYIQLMVEMVTPRPTDVLCDPAAGTCGFPVGVAEYLRQHHPEIFIDGKLCQHFHEGLFHGFDFDHTMLRIGRMNLLLHGVENPEIAYRDSIAKGAGGEENKYTLILANPPFAGSLDYENCAPELQRVVKTKKTELLFLALILRLLKPGGRAAIIVPEGVLFGGSKSHQTLRKLLVEEQKLDAVISLPGGAFKPYAGVSTALLLFTKTNSGGTDHVWFYALMADGWSLDDKRTPLLSPEKLGPAPRVRLTEDEHAMNNLPDVLARWRTMQRFGVPALAAKGLGRQPSSNSSPSSASAHAAPPEGESPNPELAHPRTSQSFCVPKTELAANNYDLSLNRYREIAPQEPIYLSPHQLLAELAKLEREIQHELKALEELVK